MCCDYDDNSDDGDDDDHCCHYHHHHLTYLSMNHHHLSIYLFIYLSIKVPYLVGMIMSQPFEDTVCTDPGTTWGVGPTGLWVCVLK